MNKFRFLLFYKAIIFLLLINSCSKDCECPDFPFGYFIDSRDNQTYIYVNIGEQTWMAENLNFETDTGSLCYKNDTMNCKAYGRLYGFKIALDVCPNGWELPSDDDWKQLELFLGMDSIEVNNVGWRSSGEVGMKLSSSIGWDLERGADYYDFKALPGGCCQINRIYSGKGSSAYFWSSEPDNSSLARYRQIRNQSKSIRRAISFKSTAYSVRCIKQKH